MILYSCLLSIALLSETMSRCQETPLVLRLNSTKALRPTRCLTLQKLSLPCASSPPLATKGALTTMPAVKAFALYAALAVIMDFLLQMTAFVALLSLDARRQDDNRCELVCCVKVNKQRPKKPHEGLLLPIMRKYYAPALLNGCVRVFVVNTAFKGGLRQQTATLR